MVRRKTGISNWRSLTKDPYLSMLHTGRHGPKKVTQTKVPSRYNTAYSREPRGEPHLLQGNIPLGCKRMEKETATRTSDKDGTHFTR